MFYVTWVKEHGEQKNIHEYKAKILKKKGKVIDTRNNISTSFRNL
jgi:hypothetical protein